MKVIAIMIVAGSPFFSHAQKQGNIWYFGDHAGLDFNTIPPTPLLGGRTDFPPPNQWNEGSSSISDSSGALLFYTNGMNIWNKQHQVMPNGSNLMGHSSSSQACIIVPLPGSSRYFYVFTTDAQENNYENGLRYSVVDICLDNGLGDVIPDQKNINLLDTASERLICVRHVNGTDYWVITHKYLTDDLYAYRLTSNGISDTIVSDIGTIDMVGWGQIAVAPNGQRIAYAAPGAATGFTLLLDFSPTSGVASNSQVLSTQNTEYAVAFSFDNSKLFFSTIGHGEIYQYDLNAGNIAAIMSSKQYIVASGPDSWRQMQLGPDGKIYISRAGKKYLSIIEFPDSLSPACNYIDSAIYLGGQNASYGLPSFIANYDYSNSLHNCGVGIDKIRNLSYSMIGDAHPNPNSGSTQIQYFVPENTIGARVIFMDMLGRVLEVRELQVGYGQLNLNTYDLPAGTYTYSLEVAGEVLDNKKIIKK